MTTPGYFQDGQCKECAGRGLCDYHKAESLERDKRKRISMRNVVASIKHERVLYLMSKHELESDEGGTAYQKAERMIKGEIT